MMEIKSMCTIELLALWGIFIGASAENVLIICVNINFYQILELNLFHLSDQCSTSRNQMKHQ